MPTSRSAHTAVSAAARPRAGALPGLVGDGAAIAAVCGSPAAPAAAGHRRDAAGGVRARRRASSTCWPTCSTACQPEEAAELGPRLATAIGLALGGLGGPEAASTAPGGPGATRAASSASSSRWRSPAWSRCWRSSSTATVARRTQEPVAGDRRAFIDAKNRTRSSSTACSIRSSPASGSTTADAIRLEGRKDYTYRTSSRT